MSGANMSRPLRDLPLGGTRNIVEISGKPVLGYLAAVRGVLEDSAWGEAIYLALGKSHSMDVQTTWWIEGGRASA